MASLVERKNKAGKVTSYRVQWRRGGREAPLEYDTFKDKRDAETFKRILEMNNHDSVKTEREIIRASNRSPTLFAVFEQHMARLTNLSDGTLQGYRRDWKNHIAPMFKDTPVETIDEDDLAEWVAYMKDKKRSPKTIANVHGFFYSLMKTAVSRKYRADNPCEETRLPKNDATEEKNTYLTKAELALILVHTKKHFHPMILFLVGTGLRFSEAMALRPGDFSDADGEYSVTVSRAWKKSSTERRQIGPPKSEKARRSVSFGEGLALKIAPLIQDCAPNDYVFKMEQGGATHSQAVYNKVWKPAVLAAQVAGLKKTPRIHDLRHTYASWQLAGGTSIFDLSRFMGHDSVNTTANVYAHLMPESRRKGAATMNKTMDGLFNVKTQKEIEAEQNKALEQ
ncbi:hypothetical protein AQ436_00305 [Arthrobacter sp. EpRS66]|nr:hypothetical protein AQ436_00305 [Arthrobacter sp. EpRS66]